MGIYGNVVSFCGFEYVFQRSFPDGLNKNTSWTCFFLGFALKMGKNLQKTGHGFLNRGTTGPRKTPLLDQGSTHPPVMNHYIYLFGNKGFPIGLWYSPNNHQPTVVLNTTHTVYFSTETLRTRRLRAEAAACALPAELLVQSFLGTGPAFSRVSRSNVQK